MRATLLFAATLAGFGAKPPAIEREKRRQTLAPTLVAVTLVLATIGGFSLASYCVGRSIEPELRFLEPRRAPSVGEAIVAFPVEYALRSTEKNDVVFVGDSTCRCGVDPAAFQRLTGLSTFNLGSIGPVGPMGFLITAKAYLLHHSPPRAMVLCTSPVAFEAGAAETDKRLASRLPSRFEASYGPEVPGIIPPDKSLRYFVQRGWLNASNWHWGSEPDVRDLPLIDAPTTETFRSVMRGKLAMRGYDPLPGVHGKIVMLDRPGVPIKIHEDWDHNVRSLAETCEKMGVPLLLRFSPMPSHLEHMKDFSPIERWAQDLQECYPKLTIGRPHLLWYDWAVCFDHVHLNSQGVALYTALLARDVRDLLGDDTVRNPK
ncbi:MAG TPA: hypothetical protein VEI07_26895 [Planctomycetaceae bacterium]|nr:hypothetical protein [Planctomycetaceae bacterium]